MARFAFFAGCIEDTVAFSIIDEGEAIESKISCVDESEVLLMEGFVEFDEIVSLEVIKYNNTFVVSRSILNEKYISSMESLVAMLTMTEELRSLS